MPESPDRSGEPHAERGTGRLLLRVGHHRVARPGFWRFQAPGERHPQVVVLPFKAGHDGTFVPLVNCRSELLGERQEVVAMSIPYELKVAVLDQLLLAVLPKR